ncbi:5702_t:CDS:2, partial [Paraglomus occultum]
LEEALRDSIKSNSEITSEYKIMQERHLGHVSERVVDYRSILVENTQIRKQKSTQREQIQTVEQSVASMPATENKRRRTTDAEKSMLAHADMLEQV